MKNTKIEWAHHTVNFWWGCTKVSPACQHCYAETLAKMWSKGRAVWGASGARWLRSHAARRELLAIDAGARERGVRERVFINSMSDTFEARADLNTIREFLFGTAVECTNVDILLLTKRPENILQMVPTSWRSAWPSHVWAGTTVENENELPRVAHLVGVPARVKFLSLEPLLGPLDLMDFLDPIDGGYVGRSFIDWIICGGESGGAARPMDPRWARALRDQCAEAGVPFFFKQWGEWCANEQLPPGIGYAEETSFRTFDEVTVWRVGKKAAGRLLDGVDHSEVPA